MSAGLDSLQPPRTLGRYELLRVLASGGMATVYLGRVGGIGGFERLVAVKCCHPHLQRDEEFASMFLDEARLAARIHHPNVVSTVDVGEDGALYFVMEYVHGVTLSEALRDAEAAGATIPSEVAVRIVVDVLSGLHAAHELTDANGKPLHLVHRDVSPQNVIIGADGVSRIVDFGIAKAEARATVTRGGQIKGKFGYMPPEQFLGGGVTRQADVYAAGVVLWEAIVGRRLFRGDSDAEVMNQVLAGRITPPSTACASAPPAVDAVVLRALASKPEHRFATAAAFAEELERAVAPASSRQVQAWVHDRFGDRLASRRELADQVRAAPSSAPRSERPTLLSRLLDGRALVVSRTTLALAVGALVVAAGALGVLAGAGRDRAPSSVATPLAAPAPPPVAHVLSPPRANEPAVAAPRAPTPKLRARSHSSRAPAPPHAVSRPAEYRPTDL